MKFDDKLMKKWDLQLFADDDDGGSGGEGDDDQKGDHNDGDGHKDDQKNAEKKYTDAEVDAIVNKKFAKLQAEKEKEIKDAKDEAAKLAKMNSDQKQQYEMEKLQKENEDLKVAAMKSELGKTAAQLLKEQKVDATQDMLDFVVGDDADQTKTNIDKFVSIIVLQTGKSRVV